MNERIMERYAQGLNRRWLLLSVWLILLPVMGWAQSTGQVDARVDRQQLAEGETLTLILESDSAGQLSQPDLSPLEQDFNVLGTSTQSSMQIVNGRTTQSTALYITLEPKRNGHLYIPSLRVGQSQTQPIAIAVSNAPQADQSGSGSVFLEVETRPESGANVYVQAQISLVVKLFYTDELTQGNLDQPDVSDAVVEQLDELKYTSRRNNQIYNVLERRYSIQAERSGELTILPIHFEGRLSGGRRSFFGSSNLGRRVRDASDPLYFSIRSRPDSFTGSDWLPARRLELSLQQDRTEVKVGEPVTRTITLQALGLTHTQLPDLPLPDLQGGRIYPDEGEGVTGKQDYWMLAQRRYQQAIVPTRPGTLHIPETRIEWWNVVSDKAETLVIPGADINVLPASGEATPAPTTPASESEEPFEDSSAAASPPITIGTPAGDASGWRWASIGFATLWLLTLLLWWRDRHRTRGPHVRPLPIPEASLKEARKQLQQACQANNAKAAQHALMTWARALWGENAPVNPRGIAQRMNEPTLTTAIEELNAACYAGNDAVWRGEPLWQVVSELKAKPSSPHDGGDTTGVLPGLYPDK